MGIRRSIIACLCTLAFTACGSSEEAPAPTPAPAAEAPAAEAPAEAPAAEAPAAEAEPAEQTLEQRIAASTPIVPAPAAQTEGEVSMTAIPCTFDGPPSISDDTFSAMGPITQASDGSLYFIDGQSRVRHYTVAPGEGCSLTMDTSFGEGGQLALGEGVGRRPESIASDANGHVYVSSAMGGTTRLTGSTQDYTCNTRGKVVVAPDGSFGFSVFGTGPIRRITFTDEGCTFEDWAAQELFERIDSVAFLDATHLLVGGHGSESSAPHLARIYSPAGQPQGAAFGDTTVGLSAPDHFCHIHGGVQGSGGRVVVLDGNCRSFRVFGSDHAIQAKIDLMRLIGLRYPWLPGVTTPQSGSAYLTAVQERENRIDVHDGYIFRVSGL